MKTFDITRTTYTVADFLTWQRESRLELSPAFQRRSVWSPGQKSYLLDTIVRGLPVPVVFIRDSINMKSKEIIRQMVDGQQRIRTVLSFVEPSCLPDYNPSRDAFTLKRAHNPEISETGFDALPEAVQLRILTYEFSTHVLPLGTEDREILQIFARMNSTGLKLSAQELRNAQYFGSFKTLMYELATEQLDRWRQWRLFSEDQLSRMKEVELVSDLSMNMIDGLKGKTQARINEIYRRLDDQFDDEEVLGERFRRTMESIDRLFAESTPGRAWRSEVNFFSLFVFVYDLQFGLGSPLTKVKPKSLPRGLAESLNSVSDRLLEQDVPDKVLDAIQRASADLGRRRTRLMFLREATQAG